MPAFIGRPRKPLRIGCCVRAFFDWQNADAGILICVDFAETEISIRLDLPLCIFGGSVAMFVSMRLCVIVYVRLYVYVRNTL